jgi:hypothetical protein
LAAGAHGLPILHSPHTPLEQYMPVPQGVPSSAFTAPLQVAVPDRQSMVFFTQGMLGSEQSVPPLHAWHVPFEQTEAPSVPHGVPSVTFWSGLQTRPPLEQT